MVNVTFKDRGVSLRDASNDTNPNVRVQSHSLLSNPGRSLNDKHPTPSTTTGIMVVEGVILSTLFLVMQSMHSERH